MRRENQSEPDPENRYIEIQLPLFEDRESLMGRVFDPYGFKSGLVILVLIVIFAVISLALKMPVKVLAAIVSLPLFLDIALLIFGTYEIHHDKGGFSERLLHRTLRHHPWEEITAVTEDGRVYVNGRQLLVRTFRGYEAFYARARAACKKQGNRVPPRREPKNFREKKN